MHRIITRKVKILINGENVWAAEERGILPYAIAVQELALVIVRTELPCYFVCHTPCVPSALTAATILN
jgi:ligand-binding sensor domain-containing protein